MTYRSRPLLDLARGQECMVRSPICNRNPETTVTAHNPFGDRGTSLKCSDWDSCWACSDCHDLLDGRQRYATITDEDREWLFDFAKARTQEAMWERGLIQVTGHTQRARAPKRIPKIVPRLTA